MQQKTKIWIGIICAALVALLWIGIVKPMQETAKIGSEFSSLAGSATIYKSPTCGCCALYGTYLHNIGNVKPEIMEMQDLSPIKQQYNIPMNMQSCHTTVIDDYFIEGHVPIEAITKLLKEKPDISGIAIPGMPMGSPGMSGAKKEPFTVYAIGKDGGISEFTKI